MSAQYLQMDSRFVMYRKDSQICIRFQQIRKKSRTAKHFKYSEVMHWFTMPASFSLLCRVASVDDYKENILK